MPALESDWLLARRVCMCCVCGWLQVKDTVGGWVVTLSRVLWIVRVGASSCWDLLEGKQKNMYFNPRVYCHFTEQITFYDLSAGTSSLWEPDSFT